MKRLCALFLLATALPAAEIIVVVKNDAGVTVSTTSITVGNAQTPGNGILAAVNQWRLAQILAQARPGSPGCPACTPPVPAVPATPTVLKYPTAGDFWRSIVRETIKPLLTEYHAAIIAKRGEIEARQAELKALEAAATR